MQEIMPSGNRLIGLSYIAMTHLLHRCRLCTYTMNKLLFLLFVTSAIYAQQPGGILIKNGKIIDGSGNPWFYGDIYIKDGKISAIGRIAEVHGARVIDATGMVVAPGFIDVHTHIEGHEVQAPTADNFI